MLKTEYEIKMAGKDKIALEKAFLKLSEKIIPVSLQENEINTIYYDDKKATLFCKNIMLRFRTVDDKGYLCIKTGEKVTPEGIAQRYELEIEAEDLKEGLEKAETKVNKNIKLALESCGELNECARVSFKRKKMRILHEKTILEICLDDGVFIGNGLNKSFCEMEAELIKGSGDALASLLIYLRDSHNLWIEEKSKYERARMLQSDAQ